MARFIAVILALVNYILFETTGQPRCSTTSTVDLAGCECNFLGACDVSGSQNPGLNISNHAPRGLEMYAGVKKFERNFTFLCEGNTVAILYDCNNRIPLYSATIVEGSQFSGEPGTRPNGRDGTFRESGTGLSRNFQQVANDYLRASRRQILYSSKKVRLNLVKDDNWYKAMNPTKKASSNPSPSNEVKVAMHRGHMIASQYGIGNYGRKVQTFVYTNAIPQFGDFNSTPWKTCEAKLIHWGRVICLREGLAQNVQMFIVVGAIPSTFYGPSKRRFFGSGGFSDFQNDESFRVNVPSWMWTASCCTYEYTKDGRTYYVTKSTAFWRENVPGKFPCHRIDVNTLEEKLTPRGETRIDLFPSSNECKNTDNYETLY